MREYLREHGWLKRGAGELAEQRRKELADALEASIRLPEKVETLVDEATVTHQGLEAQRREEDRIQGKLVGTSVIVASFFVTAALLTTVDQRYGLVGFLVALLSWTLVSRRSRAGDSTVSRGSATL